MGRLTRRLLGISHQEVSFDRRGFRGAGAAIQPYLEEVGGYFVDGYNGALEASSVPAVAAHLDRLPAAYTGFAYEGAGMALALLDTLAPWRRRLDALLAGPGEPHRYLIHVGAGWILGRLPLTSRWLRRRLDPLLGWLSLDGYGFHEGFFRAQRTVEEQRLPRRLVGYERRAFDQGLGRSLWFSEGASAEGIAATIDRFPSQRRAHLWAGVGLACAYAGGVPPRVLHTLVEAAGGDRCWLAQGVAFAAKARQAAGNLMPQTELACQLVCGLPAEEAALLTDQLTVDLPPDGELPAYEIWRRRIAQRFTTDTDKESRTWSRDRTPGPTASSAATG